MLTVNIHEAKTHLSRLVDRAHNGETIIIAKNGKPWAELMPFSSPKPDSDADWDLQLDPKRAAEIDAEIARGDFVPWEEVCQKLDNPA